MTEEDLATTLARVAEAAEAEEDTDDTWVRPAAPRDPSMVYSVRLPISEVEKLRFVAARKGMTPSALMRAWVLIRLDHEYELALGHCPRCGQPSTEASPEPVDRFKRSATGAVPWLATDLALVAQAGAPRKAAPRKAAARKAAPKKATAAKVAKTPKPAAKATKASR